jgi:hypothetical protein
MRDWFGEELGGWVFFYRVWDLLKKINVGATFGLNLNVISSDY